MHAVIKTGGKQYRVQAGDELFVEKLDVAEGEEFTFEEVLSVGTGADIQIGKPLLSGATVVADILEQGRLRKVIVFKKKRRQGYQVKRGHRQHFTRIKIKSING